MTAASCVFLCTFPQISEFLGVNVLYPKIVMLAKAFFSSEQPMILWNLCSGQISALQGEIHTLNEPNGSAEPFLCH